MFRIYYTHVALLHFGIGIVLPIWFLWRLEQGLTLTELGIASSTFWIFLLLLEVPTGVIADWFGRKWSLALASLAFTAFTLINLVANTLWLFIVAEFVQALAMSLASGSNEAYVYDRLLEAGEESGYQKKMGSIFVIDEVATLLGAVVTIFASSLFGMGSNFMIASVIGLLGAIAAMLMREPRVHKDREDNAADAFAKNPFAIIRNALSQLRKSPLLMWSVVFFSVIMFPAFALHQPQLQLIGLSVSQIALFYVVVRLFSIVAAQLSKTSRLKARPSVLALAGLIAVVAFSLMGVPFIWVSLIGFGLFYFVNTLLQILRTAFVNDAIASSERATVLSVMNFGAGAYGAMGIALIGFIADSTTLLIGFAIVAITKLVILPLTIPRLKKLH